MVKKHFMLNPNLFRGIADRPSKAPGGTLVYDLVTEITRSGRSENFCGI